MSADSSSGPGVIEPGAGMDAARMPGHFLLARLGKRVLRPGGIKMTRWILDTLDIGANDTVIEFAPGPGATARLALARRPASYIGVDRDAAAVAAVSALPHDGDTTIHGRAGSGGLHGGRRGRRPHATAQLPPRSR